MKIPVLQKNETYADMGAKLGEEYIECQQAILEHQVNATPVTRNKAISEVLDVIQVCVGLLDRLKGDGACLDELSIEHMKKLHARGWKFKNLLEVTELD